MKNKASKFLLWLIAGLVMFIVLIVVLISGDTPDSIKEAEQAEVASKQADKDAKNAEREAIIAKFNEAAKDWPAETDNIVTSATITDDGAGTFDILVNVDETAWATSDESGKESFTNSIQTAVNTVLAPETSFITFKSEQNGDVVAMQKALGGFDIKR